MKRRRHVCTGCWNPLTPDKRQFRCHFCDTGFSIDKAQFRPCHVSYHPECLRIGTPFTTRLDDNKGLSCSPDAALYHSFICESCRVRSVFKRKLHRTATDVALLMLERATIVDVYNHWTHGTMKAYKSKLNVISDFERDFKVPVLPRPQIARPPASESRPLIWTQERYSLYQARWKRTVGSTENTVKWGTIRALRSAAALQSTFNLLQSIPERLIFGFRDKPTVVSACNPTDDLGYTVFSDGMKRRIGDKSFPSAVLLDQHISWMNHHFRNVYNSATDLKVRLETCRAAITNFAAWLASPFAGTVVRLLNPPTVQRKVFP
jgi:hypothetical protein